MKLLKFANEIIKGFRYLLSYFVKRCRQFIKSIFKPEEFREHSWEREVFVSNLLAVLGLTCLFAFLTCCLIIGLKKHEDIEVIKIERVAK
jgi:hypothetical protein